MKKLSTKNFLIAFLSFLLIFFFLYKTFIYCTGNYLPKGFYTISTDHEHLDIELKCSKMEVNCSMFEKSQLTECLSNSNCDPVVVGGGVLDYKTNQNFILILRMVANIYECNNSFVYEYTNEKQYWAIDYVENKSIGPMNDLEFASFQKRANLDIIELKVPKNYYKFITLNPVDRGACKKISWRS